MLCLDCRNEGRNRMTHSYEMEKKLCLIIQLEWNEQFTFMSNL